jgi:methionyl-tRNA synthetase
VTYQEETRSHDALVYDPSKASGTWGPRTLKPGQPLGVVTPLYKKLDEKVIDEENARMGV